MKNNIYVVGAPKNFLYSFSVTWYGKHKLKFGQPSIMELLCCIAEIKQNIAN